MQPECLYRNSREGEVLIRSVCSEVTFFGLLKTWLCLVVLFVLFTVVVVIIIVVVVVVVVVVVCGDWGGRGGHD